MYEELEAWNAEMAKTIDWIEEKKLQKEIAKEFKLPVKFNTNHMLIDNPSESGNGDFTEFDEWFTKLGKKNGYTKY